MNSATADQMGTWLIAMTAVGGMIFLALGIWLQVRALRRKARRPLSLRFATKREMREMRDGIAKDLQDLSEYTHQSVHDLRDGLGAVRLRLEALRLEVRKDLETLVSPIEAKLDRVFVLVARLEVRGEQHTLPAPQESP